MKLFELLKNEGFSYNKKTKSFVRGKAFLNKKFKTHVEIRNQFIICYVTNHNNCAICEDKEYVLRCIDEVEERYKNSVSLSAIPNIKLVLQK